MAQSSSIRQKQLLKVQKDKSQARLQLHIQRFERLYNKNGAASKTKNNRFVVTSTNEMFKHDRFNRNIMMHSPLPSTFVQSPQPTIQAQEMHMNNLIKQIVETGGTTQKNRTLLAQEIEQRKLSMRLMQMQEHIHIPTTRQTLNNQFI